jgi:hypothetical protein
VFALLYAHKKMGIIPESILELGRADDSSVVRAVLIQNEKAFAMYAGSQGTQLAKNHQPALKLTPQFIGLTFGRRTVTLFLFKTRQVS